MRQKILWTAALILLNGFLILWLFYMRQHDLTTGFGWVAFLSDIIACAVLIIVPGVLLSLLISFFPRKGLAFKEKFKANFPVSLILILVFLCSVFGYVAHLEQSTGTKLFGRTSYDALVVPEHVDRSGIVNGVFETRNLLIYRRGDVQFEIDKSGPGIQEYQVQWLSDYEYMITPVGRPNEQMKVKITAISMDGYDCATTRDGRTAVMHQLKFYVPKIKVGSTGCRPYFDFDEITHFYKVISDEEAQDPAITDNYDANKKKMVAYLNYLGPPTTLENEEEDVKNLEKWGFVKAELSPTEFEGINAIFCERKHDIAQYAACIPIFRDILVFKKKERTVGVARICFACGMNHIVGSFRNTEEFGQSGDYDKLRKILHPLQ